MALGKTFGIHDAQMRYNKDTEELEILLPGNSDDPSKILRFPVGDSGQGFPVAEARQIVITSDEVVTEITTSDNSPAGINVIGQDAKIQANAPLDTAGVVTIEGIGNPTNARSGKVQLRANGLPVLTVEVDLASTQKIGVFSKAGATLSAQPLAIPDAVDLPTALTSLNSLLTAQRALGWIAE